MMEDLLQRITRITSSLKDVESLFNCGICGEVLTIPSQIQCGHVFCQNCIKKSLKREESCVQCGHKLGGQVKFRVDVSDLNLSLRHLEQRVMQEIKKKNAKVDEEVFTKKDTGMYNQEQRKFLKKPYIEPDFDFDVLENKEKEESAESNHCYTLAVVEETPDMDVQSQPLDLSISIPNGKISTPKLLKSALRYVVPLDLSSNRKREMRGSLESSRKRLKFEVNDGESMSAMPLSSDLLDVRTTSDIRQTSYNAEYNNNHEKELKLDIRRHSQITLDMSEKCSEKIVRTPTKSSSYVMEPRSTFADTPKKRDAKPINITPTISPMGLREDEEVILETPSKDSDSEEMFFCKTPVSTKPCQSQSKFGMKHQQMIATRTPAKRSLELEIIATTPAKCPKTELKEEEEEENEQEIMYGTPVRSQPKVKGRTAAPHQETFEPPISILNMEASADTNDNDSDSKSPFDSSFPSQRAIDNLFKLIEPPPKSQPRRRYSFCPSRLNRVELAKLSNLCSVCDGIITKDYTDDVTHLIIRLERGRVPQTIKYLFAIADKKWIVVFDWVAECVSQGEMISEEPYETSCFPDCDSGVRKSRLSPDKLLNGISCYFPTILKSSGASISDCKKLVEKMGGSIVRSPYEVQPKIGVLIIGEGLQNRHLYQEWYRSKGWLTTTWAWVVDCLLSFSIVQFSKGHLLTNLDGSHSLTLPEPIVRANEHSPLSSQLNIRPLSK